MLLTSNPSVALAHGLLLLSVATAVLVAAVVHPASVVGPVLSVLPRCAGAAVLDQATAGREHGKLQLNALKELQ